MPSLPALSGRAVVKVFESFGWEAVRQRSSHIILVKESHNATLHIPNTKGDYMKVSLHSHARARLQERGGTEDEVSETVIGGERFDAKYGRAGFRRNFHFDGHWQGKHYLNKQLEVYAVQEEGDWLAITVIVKYF